MEEIKAIASRVAHWVDRRKDWLRDEPRGICECDDPPLDIYVRYYPETGRTERYTHGFGGGLADEQYSVTEPQSVEIEKKVSLEDGLVYSDRLTQEIERLVNNLLK